MKLIANSLVPVNPLPYMHMGYISGAAINSAGAGIMYFGLCCLLAVFIRRLAKRTTKTVIVAMTVVLLAGAILFGYTLKQGIARGKFITTRRIVFEWISQQIDTHLSQGEAMPADIPAMQKAWGLRDTDVRDGWSHLIRGCEVQYHGKSAYLLQSAGPDGMFDTADDVGQIFVYNQPLLTLARMNCLMGLLDEHYKTNVPPAIPVLQRKLHLSDADVHDYWGHAFIIGKATRTSPYELISAGEDGKFGTVDDITLSYHADLGDQPALSAATVVTNVSGKEIALLKGGIAHETHRK